MFEWLKEKTTLTKRSFSDYDGYLVECRLEFMRDVINVQSDSIWVILLYSLISLVGLLVLIAENIIPDFIIPFFLLSVLMTLYFKYKFLKTVENEYLFFINGIEVKELEEHFNIIDDEKKPKRSKPKK